MQFHSIAIAQYMETSHHMRVALHPKNCHMVVSLSKNCHVVVSLSKKKIVTIKFCPSKHYC